MANVFISYAREDKSIVLELYKTLKSEGLPLWIDVKDILPGQNWKAEIEKAILESTIFIACLSNNSADKEGFVQAELKQALEVAKNMPEGRIYIIPVRLENCKVPHSLSNLNWVDYFEKGEVDKLFRAIQIRLNLPLRTGAEASPPISINNQEKYYDAGERMRVVRNELGLSTSQFIEAINFPSQREYEALERKEKEVSLSLLLKVSELCGVEVEWLKHGSGARYNIEAVYFNSIERDLDYLESLNPREYFLTLEPKSLHIGLIVQTGEYTYQAIETGVNLNFWNWMDEHWAISAFYRFLKALSDPWHDIDGVILPKNYEEKLYNGDIHFLAARRNAKLYGGDLLYDILDIDETRGKPSSTYAKTYGGNWMQKVHKSFKEYLLIDAERIKQKQPYEDATTLKIVHATVTFKEPVLIPTYEPAVFWKFPFDVVETSLIGMPEEIASTYLCDIIVSIPNDLVSAWQFRTSSIFSQNEDEVTGRDNLKKILFWHALKYVERKVAGKFLRTKIQLNLPATESEIFHMDVDKIPEPNGYTFNI